VIRLASERTKNGEEHDIPLSQPALDILASLPRISGSEFVFTTTGDGPIVGWSKVKDALDDSIKIEQWRVHDIRRTVATGLQKLGTPLPVTEAVLGHVAGSRAGVVGVYQRHNYADEKRAALDAWAKHVMGLVK
jgi:integrase